MKILHVDSSILGQGSVSRQLTSAAVAALLAQQADAEIIYRDLASDPLGHLGAAHVAAAQGAVPESAALRRDVEQGQKALDEFLAADIVVIGAPMYNFSIPSQLKSWIDRLAVPGKTFRYTEQGLQGLAGGKKVIIASSRGGVFAPGSPIAALDHQESYLRALFGFLGVTDISVIRAEGVAMGPEAQAAAIAKAKTEAARLVA